MIAQLIITIIIVISVVVVRGLADAVNFRFLAPQPVNCEMLPESPREMSTGNEYVRLFACYENKSVSWQQIHYAQLYEAFSKSKDRWGPQNVFNVKYFITHLQIYFNFLHNHRSITYKYFPYRCSKLFNPLHGSSPIGFEPIDNDFEFYVIFELFLPQHITVISAE